MISLAFGGYPNGSVPDSATTVVDSAGHRLEHVAAAQFLAMQAACLRDVGRTFYVAPGTDSANRTIAQQNADWATYQHGGNTAAYPGTSNHGWARAVDITGYETALSGWVFGRYVNLGAVWRWLMANMARFGFSWDTGRASKESWHFESYNTPAALADVTATPIVPPKPTPISEEENMLLISINDGDGRYGAKGVQYYALIVADHFLPIARIDLAEKLALTAGVKKSDGTAVGSAFVLTYVEWEAFKALPVLGK